MYKQILLLLSVWFARANVWPFAISFPFAPLVVGWGFEWLNVAADPLLFSFSLFFSFHSKAQRNFERNPVINISKWFIHSIFTLCSSRDTFYERSEMLFARHTFIEHFSRTEHENQWNWRRSTEWKRQIDCVNSHNQHYIERERENVVYLMSNMLLVAVCRV